MSKANSQNGGIATGASKSVNTRSLGRPPINKSTKSSSRSTSRRKSSFLSPNKYQMLVNEQELEDNDVDDEVWQCKLCKHLNADPDSKLLECQRYRDHVCIKCSNKTDEEYNMMANSDMMWFCITCKEKVEKNIITDMKIEESAMQ